MGSAGTGTTPAGGGNAVGKRLRSASLPATAQRTPLPSGGLSHCPLLPALPSLPQTNRVGTKSRAYIQPTQRMCGPGPFSRKRRSGVVVYVKEGRRGGPAQESKPRAPGSHGLKKTTASSRRRVRRAAATAFGRKQRGGKRAAPEAVSFSFGFWRCPLGGGARKQRGLFARNEETRLGWGARPSCAVGKRRPCKGAPRARPDQGRAG